APARRVAVEVLELHHAHLRVEDRPADAARLAHRVARFEAAEDRGLRLAEALLQHDPVSLEGADLLGWNGGARAEDEAQRREIRARARARELVLEQRELRRHGAEEADALLADESPRARGVEARLERERGAGVERRQREDAEPEGVEERQDHEHAV